MSRESATRQALLKTLRKIGFDAMAVDNESCLPGTADVNWAIEHHDNALCAIGVEGWIECKKLDAWPKRPTTVVSVPHFTQKQRTWIDRRTQHGGNVTVLLHVGKHERILLPGEWAAVHLGFDATEADIRAAAIVAWVGSGRDVLARALLLSRS